MTALLQAFLASPELQAVVAVAIVSGIVWVWKKVGKLPSGAAALQKRLVAAVTSVLVVAAGEWLRATQTGTAIEWGRIVPAVVLAFIAATGWHTLLKAARKRKPIPSDTPPPA